MLESADLELETADSSTDSNADAAKVGVWALTRFICYDCYNKRDGFFEPGAKGEYVCQHGVSTLALLVYVIRPNL